MSTTTDQRTTSVLHTLWGWVVGFGRFWYQFIIGDDWRIAAAVVGALLAAWGLSAIPVAAWWLVPLAVVAVTYLTLLERARTDEE